MRAQLARAAALVALAGCHDASKPLPAAPAPEVVRSAELDPNDGCADDDLELLLPFYEGVLVRAPATSLEAAKLSLDIGYPGVVSVPLVGVHCAGSPWKGVAAPVAALGTSLRVTATDGRTRVEIECPTACRLRSYEAPSWQELARAAARDMEVRSKAEPLASRFTGIHFYVRRWVAREGEPVRTAWGLDRLIDALGREDGRSIVHVYGLDPGGVDLGGSYFSEPGSLDEARRLVAANPKVSLFSWLNLRTYKHAVPARGIDLPLTDEVRAMARLYPHESIHSNDQYVYKAWEMCLGSREWQSSRMHELQKLVGLGFKVIALDEFPIPVSWAPRGCLSTQHLHAPGDFADESRVARELVARLAEYARAHGVLLGSEEPSAAYLPYVSGYVDRMANPPAMYEVWASVAGAAVVPMFSTMFGGMATPYTDIDAKRVPEGWLPDVKREDR